MKKQLSIITLAVGLALSASATVNVTGTAVTGPFLTDGQTGVFLIDSLGTGFADLASSDRLSASADLLTDATYGNGFVPIATDVVVTDFLGGKLYAVGEVFPLAGNVGASDSFGFIIFENSAGTTTPGDTFRVYSDPSWTLPSDGGAFTFPGGALGSQSLAIGTVAAVPEPSSFALIAGFLGIASVMIRRRK